MIFSDRRKRHLCLKKETWLLKKMSQKRKNSSTLPSWLRKMIRKQVHQPLRYRLQTIPDLSRDECKITIDKMSNELYNLHVSLKSLTKENSRLKRTIESTSGRNYWLENELVVMERLKTKNQDSREELVRSLQREKSLSEKLRKEHDVIKSWNNSSWITRASIENKIKEAIFDPKSSKEKKPVEEKQSTDNYLSTGNYDNDYPSVKKNLTDDNYLLNKKKPSNKTI